MADTIRLQVFLSRSGVASRRSSAEVIREGRVRVNNQLVTEPGYRVSTGDSVSMDDSVLSLEEEKVYLVLNKPRMVISSAHDPEGRVTVMEIVQRSFSQRLFPVGRLDYLSTGLIFITNDGQFANTLGHPRLEYARKYEVESKQSIPRSMLQDWQKGLRIATERYNLKHFYYTDPRKVILTLTEGRNREIRNVFEHYEIPIISLHRTQFGPLALGNLKPGKFRVLSAQEVKLLLMQHRKRGQVG